MKRRTFIGSMTAGPAGNAPMPNIPKVRGVVVNRKDRSVTVLEDGKVVAKGMAHIQGDQPLGESVYHLTGSDPDRRKLS